MVNRKKLLAAFSGLLAVSLVVFQGAAAAQNSTLKIVCANEGSNIYTPPESVQYSYRYGPAILIDGNRIDIWASAPPLVSNGVRYGNDSIEYTRSMDGGKTWTDWKVVLYPTLDSEDKWSTCDPGAFKYGDYYYVGYTGSPEFRTDPSKEKAVNNLFIARAKNPEGPYEKWNGSGWGGKPYAITRYSGNGVGCSMPAFTVKDDRLYMYYVDQTKYDQDWNSYGNISVSVFPLKDPNWPGKQISNDRCKNEPEEVKYCPETGKFIGFQLLNGWDYDSYVSVMESKDGINFEKTTTFRSNFPHYAHNIGVSGNTLGQLDLSITNYIGAAYTPTGDEAWWGHWHTRLAPLYIKTESPATTAKPTTTKPATPTTKPKKTTATSPESKPVENPTSNAPSNEASEPASGETTQVLDTTSTTRPESSAAPVIKESADGLPVWAYMVIAGGVVLLAGGGVLLYLFVFKKKRVK